MPEANATTPLASRSPQSVVLDNVLRRELRLSDPRDPDQIANALLGYYPSVKDQMDRERNGFAYSDTPAMAPVAPQGRGATSSEIDQATDDLDRDLTSLTTSSELKDIRVELIGWSRAVRQAASDGLAAGALALDMVQFDRAMSARRTLCDYARLSRYVGAMSGDTSPFFRHFAQSCDVMAGLVLVTMGEGLAANGVTRGTAIVRVAAGDLQSRRNAVINALRNLTGSSEASLGQEDWPRGMEAYRNLVQQLEASGQTDLRTLLDESALAPALDQLVDLATGSTSSGLRELSTASTMLVQRLQQLLVYGQVQIVPPGGNIAIGSPESPPLTAFLSALQLFIDAFTTTSSDRLLYLARPAIVTYGLYGMAGPDVATQRLINLAMMRGQIAEQIDCFANCGCDAATVRTEVLLDLLLYRVDRAIDSYAVGSDPDGLGSPEIRAGATAMLINTLLADPAFLGAPVPAPPALPPPGALGAALRGQLQGLAVSLQAAFAVGPQARINAIAIQELGVQYRTEQQIERLVRALSPVCRLDGVFANGVSVGRAAIQAVFPGVDFTIPAPVQMPSPIASSFASFAQGRPDFVIAAQP
jgi:hypothetical protein